MKSAFLLLVFIVTPIKCSKYNYELESFTIKKISGDIIEGLEYSHSKYRFNATIMITKQLNDIKVLKI
jgi:hypothetical protein